MPVLQKLERLTERMRRKEVYSSRKEYRVRIGRFHKIVMGRILGGAWGVSLYDKVVLASTACVARGIEFGGRPITFLNSFRNLEYSDERAGYVVKPHVRERWKKKSEATAKPL